VDGSLAHRNAKVRARPTGVVVSHQAAEHYEQALEIERRWGARAWLVRTRTNYAELLITRARHGDRVFATELACEAIAQAHTLGMSPRAISDAVRQVAEAALSRS
jgi:hypothetical protein